MATHSSILAWRIPWTEDPGGLQSMRSQRVTHGWGDLACTHVVVSIVQVRKLAQRGAIVSVLPGRDKGSWVLNPGLLDRDQVYYCTVLITCFDPRWLQQEGYFGDQSWNQKYMGTREPPSPPGKVTACHSVSLVIRDCSPVSMLWGSLVYQHPLAKEFPDLESENDWLLFSLGIVGQLP